ncbi:Pam3-gp28 family putative phage holin [Sphingomonas nostoxanthinifaciens]|uniref:Pam3-gp28 family putative phage holin n=1 Tax=Sphingomonas nostoxanthinifaciens TaxID=2872652 RepID=UPI001CC1D067|nr:hypothetical protein [Sphingomonas nostoxanthinifaciens]UAK24170.1 hypothetical protein K8P63_17865 [Sphingomonas nostoxanthinifaciens]
MSDLPAPVATAVHALLASLVRHALVAAGSALVTRGIVDQGAVDGFIATMVETIVGTLMVAGATGWAQARAFLSHTRWPPHGRRSTSSPHLFPPLPPVRPAALAPSPDLQSENIMSKLFVGFLNSAQLTALHAAGHAVEQFALSETQKVVATLKATSIGATVTADIKALKDSTLTGAEKFEQVVTNTAPLVLSYVTGGGLASLASDAADVARELVQSLYNDVASALKVAAAPAAAAA